jgi:hypothetical protein
MNMKFERFESGWLDLSIALRADEIDELVSLLGCLRRREVGHFHFRAIDFSAKEGVADIEFTTQGEDEPDNMGIG